MGYHWALAAAFAFSGNAWGLVAPGAPETPTRPLQVQPAPAAVVEITDPRYRAIRVEVPASELERGASIEEHYRSLVRISRPGANIVVVQDGRVFFRRAQPAALARIPEEPPVALPAANTSRDEPAAPIQPATRERDTAPQAQRRPRTREALPWAEPEFDFSALADLQGPARTDDEIREPQQVADEERAPDPLPLTGEGFTLEAISQAGLSTAPAAAPARAYAVIALESRGSILLASLDEAGEWLVRGPGWRGSR